MCCCCNISSARSREYVNLVCVCASKSVLFLWGNWARQTFTCNSFKKTYEMITSQSLAYNPYVPSIARSIDFGVIAFELAVRNRGTSNRDRLSTRLVPVFVCVWGCVQISRQNSTLPAITNPATYSMLLQIMALIHPLPASLK